MCFNLFVRNMSCCRYFDNDLFVFMIFDVKRLNVNLLYFYDMFCVFTCALCVPRLGAFGATFIPGSPKPSETIIYASRPGLRIWKADIIGSVHETMIFTNFSAKRQLLYRKSPSPLTTGCTRTETETGAKAVDFPTAQFGLLQVYCKGLLVSHTLTDLLVVSPEDSKQIIFMLKEEGILDVAVNRDEIFVLRKHHLRPLIRLRRCPQQFNSSSTAKTVSHLHPDAYREFA